TYEIYLGTFEDDPDGACEVLCCHSRLPLAAHGADAVDASYRGTARAYRDIYRATIADDQRFVAWLLDQPDFRPGPDSDASAFARRCLADDLRQLRARR